MSTLRFDGADYKPIRDNPRLSSQYRRIFRFMEGGGWHTLEKIEAATGDPPASISAQLRHMRKERFGAHVVNRRHLGKGLYAYQLLLNPEAEPLPPHQDDPVKLTTGARPPCKWCGMLLSPAVVKEYTGRDPQCGGMVPGIHVGVTRNGITCRADDPADDRGRRSNWREIRDQIKERSKRR